MLAFGIDGRNYYMMFLSILAFLVVSIAGIIGRRIALRMAKEPADIIAESPTIAGRPERVLHFRFSPNVPVFFRVVLSGLGFLKADKNAGYYCALEAVGNNGFGEIVMEPPETGMLIIDARLSVSDVFGLTKNIFLPVMRKNVQILPDVWEYGKPPVFEVTGGLEEKNRREVDDEQRFYMREYVPGDRFRDINWKSSSRIGQLVTRVPPRKQMKTQTIVIELRPYKKKNLPESLDSVMQLRTLKGWLLSFIRTVKERYPDYTFRIHVGKNAYSLSNDADITSFAEKVSLLYFRPEDASVQRSEDSETAVVFSTAFDTGLSQCISQIGNENLWLFFVRSAVKNEQPDMHIPIRFSSKPGWAPGTWIFRREATAEKHATGIKKSMLKTELSVKPEYRLPLFPRNTYE